MNNVIGHFSAYNKRRYSRPWVCRMAPNGSHDFSARVGIYTGDMDGDEGDLIIFDPVEGQIYGYGQKDYRGNHTQICYAIWDGAKFVRCDRLGRLKRRGEDEV